MFLTLLLKLGIIPGRLLGLAPLSIVYFSKTLGTGLYSWFDLVVAIIWIVFNYFMAFRSPIYNALDKKSQYAFSDDEVDRARYMG